jgi:stage V sporulation protein D (sporulation-specific penicillin-binding protein)
MTLGARVGIENYQKYVKGFGYYEKTGIDLPGEGNSIFASQMTELDLAIYAFGQNFNVTPIQHITAISAVANGGNLLTPYVVEKITDHSGNVIYSHKNEVKRTTVSADVCKTISTMLEEGVSGDGGAKNAYVAGYKVAAKTGTSEKKERECPRCGYTAELKTVDGQNKFVCSVCKYTGEPDEFEVSEDYICSTVAYAPADDPQVAIIIIVDEPTKGVLYGSTVAAPYVSDALEKILPQLGITAEYSESELSKLKVSVGSYRSWSVDEAKEAVETKGLKCVVVGDGETVSAQKPSAGSYVEKNSGGTVYLYTDPNLVEKNVTVPDLTGLTAATANAKLIGLGLNIRVEGNKNHLTGTSAVVFSQSVAPGTLVAKGEVIKLTFIEIDADEAPSYRDD